MPTSTAKFEGDPISGGLIFEELNKFFGIRLKSRISFASFQQKRSLKDFVRLCKNLLNGKVFSEIESDLSFSKIKFDERPFKQMI